MVEKDATQSDKQRRKIPPHEWASIAARYGGGESLASIARSYSCTPPAIRYILGREVGDLSKNLRPIKGRTVAAPSMPAVAGEPLRTPRLDSAIRDAATAEIANFLVALENAVESTTPQTLNTLRRTADRLMGAVARVRIALEVAPTALAGRLEG